jgi:hypothetical protein
MAQRGMQPQLTADTIGDAIGDAIGSANLTLARTHYERSASFGGAGAIPAQLALYLLDFCALSYVTCPDAVLSLTVGSMLEDVRSGGHNWVGEKVACTHSLPICYPSTHSYAAPLHSLPICYHSGLGVFGIHICRCGAGVYMDTAAPAKRVRVRCCGCYACCECSDWYKTTCSPSWQWLVLHRHRGPRQHCRHLTAPPHPAKPHGATYKGKGRRRNLFKKAMYIWQISIAPLATKCKGVRS